MTLYERLLVPTDGSTVSAAAGEAAVAVADRFGATLHVVHVLEPIELPPDLDGTEAFDRQDNDVPAGIEAIAADAGVETRTATLEREESVHRTILDYVDEHGIDCIVMGTHGRSGLEHLVLGSVTELTLRQSPVPVMTVHEDTIVDPTFDTVVVPTDGSDCATAAVRHAIDLATSTGAALHVVNVVDLGALWGGSDVAGVLDALEDAGERALESVRERAEAAGVSSVVGSCLSGTPHRAIVEYAEANDADCIVMGTHGRTGLNRLLLGSVTEWVIRHTDVPVLAVREVSDD